MSRCSHCGGTGKCQDDFHSGVNLFGVLDDDAEHPSFLDNLAGSCPSCGDHNTERRPPCPHCDGEVYNPSFFESEDVVESEAGTTSDNSYTYHPDVSGSSTPSVRGLSFSFGLVVFAIVSYLLVSAISWIFIIPFIVNTKITGIGVWILKVLAIPLVLFLFIVTIPGIGLLVWAIPGFSELLPSLHP